MITPEEIQQRAKFFVGKYWPTIQEPTASDIYHCVYDALTALQAEHAKEVKQLTARVSDLEQCLKERTDTMALEGSRAFVNEYKNAVAQRDAIRAELAALKAERDALLKDKEMLDWLDENPSRDPVSIDRPVSCDHFMGGLYGNFREAITAAMEASK